MRLIDADLLKKNCKCTGKFEDNFVCVDLIELAKVINAQPTAYSVEKVVAELKENSKVYCEEYHQREGSLYIQDVVEIVRNGGKG